MAYEALHSGPYSFKATAAYTTEQHHLMVCGADGYASLAGAGGVCIGVLQNKPSAAGQAAEIAVYGITKVVSDGSGVNIVVGDKLKADASGHAVKAATDADMVAGIALNASTAAGTIISMILTIGAQRAS